jgi:exopolyphosphatase / guanosine-5'-triphosphate,3'-diphosphate pyrophosphatase
LARETTTTRLGQGVGATRRLAAEAIERTLDCLRRYRTIIDMHAATAVRATGTAALRAVSDPEPFLVAAQDVLGVPVELLAAADEATLAFTGATAGLDRSLAPFLVLDIGGGSTELCVGEDEPAGLTSLDLGSVGLTESVLLHDPPQPEELTNAIGLVQDELDDALREVPMLGEAATIVGVAGTIVSIAAVELGRYDREALHHFVLTRDAAEDVFRTLATEPLTDRLHNPGLPRERADIIVGGACILVAILRRLHAPELLVSQTDLLDALARQLV